LNFFSVCGKIAVSFQIANEDNEKSGELMENNQSYLERVLAGKERTEGGRRKSIPEGRWRHAWDIFKGRLGRLFLLNLIVLVTFAPIVLLYFQRTVTLITLRITAPNGAGLGVGYPVIPGTDVAGFYELSVFQADIVFFSLLIGAGVVAAIGISGGMYLIRNLLRTDGVFDFKDFFRGIRYTFWNVLEAVLIFTTVLFVVQVLADLSDYYVALGIGNPVWLLISKIVGYIIVAIVLMISLWMISLSANYKQGPWELFRNACYCLVKSIVPSIFLAAFALFPFLFVLINVELFVWIGVALLVTVAFSSAMLSWMAYSQWIFDAFTAPVIQPERAKKKVEPEQKPVDEETAANNLQLLMLAYGKSTLSGRPMQTILEGKDVLVVPEQFTRESLTAAAENRSDLIREAQEFEDLHKSEPRYADYNKQFEDRDKALKSDKKKRAKGAPKMLNER